MVERLHVSNGAVCVICLERWPCMASVEENDVIFLVGLLREVILQFDAIPRAADELVEMATLVDHIRKIVGVRGDG